jgi:hypothetical protein
MKRRLVRVVCYAPPARAQKIRRVKRWKDRNDDDEVGENGDAGGVLHASGADTVY